MFKSQKESYIYSTIALTEQNYSVMCTTKKRKTWVHTYQRTRVNQSKSQTHSKEHQYFIYNHLCFIFDFFNILKINSIDTTVSNQCLKKNVTNACTVRNVY